MGVGVGVGVGVEVGVEVGVGVGVGAGVGVGLGAGAGAGGGAGGVPPPPLTVKVHGPLAGVKVKVPVPVEDTNEMVARFQRKRWGVVRKIIDQIPPGGYATFHQTRYNTVITTARWLEIAYGDRTFAVTKSGDYYVVRRPR